MPLLQSIQYALTAFIVLANAILVESTVSYGGHVFESMPAHFGMSWAPSARTYQAHLQFLPDRPKLCKEGFEGEGVEGLEGLVLPNSSFPVALLVERGNCSFEEKASVAMQAYPAVSFMVVYDDQPSKNLVSMRETFAAHEITLGMLFVSYRSGMALRAILQNQTDEVLAYGGPIIGLDGLDPVIMHEPSLKDLQTWILIAMGGFFTFITVFGCLLIFVQLGLIPVNGAGQIILTQEAMRRSRRLLSRVEVARFQPGGDLYGKCAMPHEVETQPSDESPGTLPNDPEQKGNDAMNTEAVNLPEDDLEEDQTCAVCLDELVSGHVGEEGACSTLCLPCPANHHFHVDCIVPWLTERQANCPLCKFDLLEYMMELDEKTTEKKSVSRCSLEWCKQQVSRVMGSSMGWSPIQSSDSHAESSTSNSDNGGETSSDVPSGVSPI